MGNPIIGIYIPKFGGPTFTKKIEGFADVCIVWGLGYTILIHPEEKNMLPMKMAFVVAYPYFHTH